ncbi:hypothetical protein [Pseudescherichia sp.]|uniref:hypothetical protein n=1 Tax=Pseudescherichia sp. TaxID=2055881 RepID=UPI00289AEE5E|nr:hypothetical protein [Pseudescherichia sp.]
MTFAYFGIGTGVIGFMHNFAIAECISLMASFISKEVVFMTKYYVKDMFIMLRNALLVEVGSRRFRQSLLMSL